MPYVEETEYEKLINTQEEYLELEDIYNKEKEKKSAANILNIILGALLLLSLAALAYYVLSYSKGITKVEETQQVVETQVINDYEQKIASLEQQIKTLGGQESLTDKVVYAVQIGAFKERDMSMYSPNLVNFKEISNSGYNKYALGNFETLAEAQKFRKELVRLGFNDAFIASYKNNERLKIEEAY